MKYVFPFLVIFCLNSFLCIASFPGTNRTHKTSTNEVTVIPVDIRVLAQLPPQLYESSGIAITRFNGIWSHEDSNNENELYKINTQGELLRTLVITNATNVDWEDLAVDDQGRIYINDAGNNQNDRTDLVIYRIPDPNTISGNSVNAEIIEFDLEDQFDFPPPSSNRNFDIEAIIWHDDSLFLFTKNRSVPLNGYSKMYSLPAEPGNYTAQLVDSVFIDDTHQCGRVTAADIHPINGELVLLTGCKMVSFRNYPGNRFFDGDRTDYVFTTLPGQNEAIAFVTENRFYMTEEGSGGSTGFLYEIFKHHADEPLEVITQWTFDGTTDPSTGSGTASLIGGVTQHSVSPLNGWRITNFPDQFAASGTAGAQFMLSTAGYTNIILDFGHRSSGTMSRWAEIQYTTNGGETWNVFDNNQGKLSPHDWEYAYNFDFSDVEEAGDNPDFGVRIVSAFSPVAFNPEVPDQYFPAHTAYHRSRTLGTGGNAYSGEGNWRLLSVSFLGSPILKPEQLAITSVNQGDSIFKNKNFNIHVEARDGKGWPIEAEDDVLINLSIETGTGQLGGTLSGVIPSGSSSVLISGITYNTAENNVVIRAEADGLEPAVSEPFNVYPRIFNIHLAANIDAAGNLNGSGEYEVGEPVSITAEAYDGYVFIHWIVEGEVFSTEPEYSFQMPDKDMLIEAIFNVEYSGEAVVFHYWHFNTLTGETVTEVASDYSATGLSANITYPGTGSGYLDARTHRPEDPVSNFNLLLGETPDQGAVLRARNPSNTRKLLITAPSLGFSNLVISFATTRTNNGAQQQAFYYSPDHGETWTKAGNSYMIPLLNPDIEGFGYLHQTIDLSHNEHLNNNPGLLFKIRFEGSSSYNTNGNNRFDNIGIAGVPVDTTEVNNENLYLADSANVFIGHGESFCFASQHSIIVAGSGYEYKVEAGAELFLIAAQSIHLLPGTVVEKNGYLSAKIEHDPDCGIPFAKEVEVDTIREDVASMYPDKFFRLYPNPTDGFFRLELSYPTYEKPILVEIYDLMGHRLMREKLPPQQFYDMNLAYRQPGIYIIRITKGSRSGVARLIITRG